MADFGKIVKGIGKAIASDMEGKARSYSNDKRFSNEAREEYARFADGMNSLKNGELLRTRSDDDDDY